MGVGRTNPANGLSLEEAMSTEQLIPSNNLADLPNRATALSNLGITATAAEINAAVDGLTATFTELNALDGIGTTVTVVSAAGANNESVVTVTVKDASGATVAAVHALELWFSAASTGIGLTGTAYSGTLVASTGAIHTTLTAKKHFTVVTAATGIFAGTLTDSAETADFCAVRKPLGAGVVVSSALTFG